MNKAQLIELIQSKLGADTTKKHAEEALAAVLESIKEGVKESGKVQIIGFDNAQNDNTTTLWYFCYQDP